MKELESLEAMGLVLPTPWYIAGAILFGLIGWAVYRRGRQSGQSRLVWMGLALMLYPYAVSETWMLWAVGVALTAVAYWIGKRDR
jgi:hypothetical protein